VYDRPHPGLSPVGVEHAGIFSLSSREEERAGERRVVRLAGAPACQKWDAPLPDPLPTRSSWERGKICVRGVA